ncbi:MULTISPECIES: ABC transporter permease [unclassified Imperialibacter]|uniref:ABC transporter permease n=1 Tax=unclassified Imperialibacter TaxID=2629706 RepID=UPI001257B065|nr:MULTISPECIES: ABC transporter permease [unclassified Imperialibacter]CAD5270508.1 conserved membrane hypothetical protein [Imperialibacter sp. 75]CAD5298914.1 conserved membrane hypothetical protein [Imperialibacter sp. 89]VVT35722.1 conserved membrane hypothetical protein [Imperialibacter sp. EC-SDR9]
MTKQHLPEPPGWALKLLHWYCKPSYLEAIEGDLYELFDLRCQSAGEKAARRGFAWDVLRFFRWKYIKGLENSKRLNQFDMWKNYFKISLRSLWRQKFYSSINIMGLSVGIACCLLIIIYIKHDLSYDRFWREGDRIYRIAINDRGPYTPTRLGALLKSDYPEVESYTRLNGLYDFSFAIGDNVFSEPGGSLADSTVFDVFDVKFIEGTPRGALSEPNTVVLTKSVADKYFPHETAVGKIIKSSGDAVKITAVVEDPPINSHMPFKYLVAMPHEYWVTTGWWTGNNFFTYVKLVEGASEEAFEAKMLDFMRKHMAKDLMETYHYEDFDDYLASDDSYRFTLVPIQRIHLNYPRLTLAESAGSMDNVYIFSAVAFFILLIACINFINLSTARSGSRSKEVGIRKVLGSVRGELIRQFMVESFLISIFSLGLAILLSLVALPYFNDLSGKQFLSTDLITVENMLWLTLLLTAVGIIAGSYPALYLSSFKPVAALKGELKSGKSGSFLRKALVSFQFAISIFLVIATVIVYQQINHMTDQKLGFNSSNTMVIKAGSALKDSGPFFRSKLLESPNIESVATSTTYPSQFIGDWGYSTVGDVKENYSLYTMFADSYYLETMGVELAQGRFFSRELASDTASIVLNEAAVRELGWDDPIGQRLERTEGVFTVIGVVKDFNFSSLKRKIGSLAIRYDPEIHKTKRGSAYYLARVNGNYQETVNYVNELWGTTAPEEPFDYDFVDQAFAKLYESEAKFGKIFTVFSALAILIACLGLFAMAAYTLEKRFKEIAIRKVLGASVFSITTLVLSDFTKLILLGSVIAVPFAFYVMEQWLQEFAYRMELGILVFLIPVLSVTLLAWLTVIYQSLKTATGNPVNALKQE